METIHFAPPQLTETADRFRIDLPQACGRGGCNLDVSVFRSGLKLIVMKTEASQPLRIEGRAPESVAGFGFCLHGEFATRFGSSTRTSPVRAGDSGFFTLPVCADFTEDVTSGHMLRIYLMLGADSLTAFAQGDEDYFSPLLTALGKKQPSCIVHPTTALMNAILHQIQACPYQGKTGALYLESKAIELLSHKLEQLYPSAMRHDKGSCALKAADRERVVHVAEMLVADLENPPDMALLARSAGLSRSKLHRCFRQTYGVSPFEYLRNHRLQTAMLLLQEGEINVTQAALSVGYTNLSYFAKAFKAMFGVAPGELLHRSA
ncbi:AraC family transcriptional regulator [uncultured Desulfuromonas sp.]|uniref:helix-turn-helix transcriptional regulator n=1 Tax=uncultured Desulfuromonas sp. TaxID=181013 RepID=UPI002AAC0310|nr:AraC family transcriptional regulator [uncultured Desulfuromonas sp.]